MTCEEVAESLECSPSKISRMETGRVGIHPRDVRDLLALYETEGEERDALMAIARQARERGWWEAYDKVLRKLELTYIGMEADASHLYQYEAQFFPGLLQIEPYAQEIEKLEKLVAARMARQRLLTKTHPIKLWTILDEAVLRRAVGGPLVLRDQLDHVLKVSRLTNVTIQVLPFSAGAHAATAGPFVIMEFPEPVDPDLVYLDGLTKSAYLEKVSEVETYRAVFTDLISVALSPADSRELIADTARALD